MAHTLSWVSNHVGGKTLLVNDNKVIAAVIPAKENSDLIFGVFFAKDGVEHSECNAGMVEVSKLKKQLEIRAEQELKINPKYLYKLNNFKKAK